MRIEIGDYSSDVFPTEEEIKDVCKIGQGADCCIWLVCGADGFRCTGFNKPIALLDNWMKGKTTAKRDGCDKINNFDMSPYIEGDIIEI